MTQVRTIATDVEVDCIVRERVTAICPVTDERDRYVAEVKWRTAGETFEKHALVDALNEYTNTEITQEALAAEIYGRVSEAEVTDLSVTLRDTEHMDMVVSKE